MQLCCKNKLYIFAILTKPIFYEANLNWEAKGRWYMDHQIKGEPPFLKNGSR